MIGLKTIKAKVHYLKNNIDELKQCMGLITRYPKAVKIIDDAVECLNRYRDVNEVLFATLQAYEDTGLSPERCVELAKAEQEGLLVKLPCKINDRLWWYTDDPDDPPYVRQDDYPISGIAIKSDGFYIMDCDNHLDKIGTQYAFLTKEDAEKALEGE